MSAVNNVVLTSNTVCAGFCYVPAVLLTSCLQLTTLQPMGWLHGSFECLCKGTTTRAVTIFTAGHPQADTALTLTISQHLAGTAFMHITSPPYIVSH